MSGRFVSGGTISSNNEDPAPSASTREDLTSSEQASDSKSSKMVEWELVEKELAAERQHREEQRRRAATGEEKSLYDILQENKAAKQAAFEEQNRIKNQFRALDDDEADFLDEVREMKRRAEEAVKRETEEGLQAFRRAQKGKGDGAAAGGGGGDGEREEGEEEEEEEEENWGVGRKRRRVKEREVKGVRRKVSAGQEKKGEEGEKGTSKGGDGAVDEAKGERTQVSKVPVSKPLADKQIKPPALGLGDYGSDSDE